MHLWYFVAFMDRLKQFLTKLPLAAGRLKKKRRQGLQLGVNLVAATRDLFHFKLELTPNWSERFASEVI